MSIETQLKDELKSAMRARDSRTANTIRMINTKVTERRTAKGFKGQVDDALFLDVIGAYKKSLEKARVEFEAGGDRAAQQIADLDFEIEYCARFLPQPLSEDETRAAVETAIEETGASDPKMKGRVVGAVMKAHKGRVDPGLVQRLVAEKLESAGG